MRKKRVWRKIPRSEAQQRGIKVVGTRWLDINKGDQATPVYRSRFVAKEYNTGPEEGLFAATPPLEAVRLLVSDAATRGPQDIDEKIIMVNDVARAFFEAPVRRIVCVELPPEEQVDGEDAVGLLQMSLYGTRDAAANFQREVQLFMSSVGFTQSTYSPIVFIHKTKGLKTMVHGDDFLSSGTRDAALWFKRMLEKRFDIKSVLIGHGVSEVPEGRILGRIVRAAEGGSWEYEADPRHAELLVYELGLSKANGVSSPGEDEKPWEENSDPLPADAARLYRGMAARANYLAQDRSDLQFAAKEVCRGMAQPTVAHLRRLKRLGRFLLKRPRVVWCFALQLPVEQLTVFSDSDWAGCRRTARSTSGGAILRGSHCLRTWCTTQKCVTLSSGEAELMALVKATSEALGLAQLADSWGLPLQINVLVDSSAALAVTARKGNGKLRHVRIGYLWVQELADTEVVQFVKVRGEANPADLMTKHLTCARAGPLIEALAQRYVAGHAKCRIALYGIA